MAGNLSLVSTTTVSSAVSELIITGLNDNAVYLYLITDVIPSNDGTYLSMQFTESGTIFVLILHLLIYIMLINHN